MNAKEQAISAIKASLGLTGYASTWTYEQKLAFSNALATYIAAHPESFTAQDYSNAIASLNKNQTGLSDTSFVGELSDFGGYFLDNAVKAGESVAGIGQGVLSFASLSKWLIPLAGVAAVIVLLFALNKRANA